VFVTLAEVIQTNALTEQQLCINSQTGHDIKTNKNFFLENYACENLTIQYA